MTPKSLGITSDQWADAERQLGADVRASQDGLNLQVDIETDIALSRNPDMFENLSMPMVEVADGRTAEMMSNPVAAARSDDHLIDPRTGLRAGPTKENLIALGMPLSHSTSGLMTKDLLPGSILSGDYATQNDVLLNKELRAERVSMLLKSREDVLRSVGENYGVDPRSIGAAISWEYVENTGGYMSDQLLPAAFQNGYGWGQIHDGTLRNEMIPGISMDQSIALRSNLDSAIDLVGARIRQQVDTYQSISGIDLSNNPVASTWLFNTSSDYVQRSARNQVTRTSAGLTPTLNIRNDMAHWTSQNLKALGWLAPKNPVANQGIAYRYTVNGEQP